MLIALIMVSPYIYRIFQKKEVYDFTTFEKEIEAFRVSAKLEQKYSDYKGLKNEIEDKELRTDYFDFDPNGLSEKDWRKLGLSTRQIKVIKNYEAKGGKFYKREDVKKIYSITAAQYAGLEPFINIQSAFSKKDYKPYKSSEKFKKLGETYKRPIAIIVELNEADSAKMESIRGIGPAFASRIIKYRTRLGGFYSKIQLREVYGLDSVKYEQLKDLVSVDMSSIRKININTAIFEDLKRHPYLTYKQINAIIQYRKQHGYYKSIADLKKVAIVSAEIIIKIEPYLTFND